MLLKYFVCSAVFISFGFFIFRVIVRRDYLKKSKLSALSYSLEVLIFALHANFIYLFIPVKWPNLPSLPDSMALKLISILIFCFGLVILIIAWFELGSGTSLGLDKKGLNSKGIYQYSRNPQLIGYGVVLFSFAVIFLSWYSVGWLFLYLVISYFMVKTEEEFLNLRYAEKYKKYCSAVPRIIKLH
jgi:protein-S-isoprenylcysteine O-methyltransferase Ste14